MAPTERKRSREGNTQGSKKRQKVGKAIGTTRETSTIVRLDSLPWNEVPLPDRLEDAEGFFGLEEVENVEVAKDPSSGQVAYRVPLNAVPKDTTAPWSDNSVTGAQTGEEQEWSGFEISDGRSDTQPLHVEKIAGQVLGKSVPSRKQKHSIKLSTYRQEEAKEILNGGPSRGNTFEALQEAIDDEADVSAWEVLDLSSHTLSFLARLRFSTPTPIQNAAIPEILNGHDVIGKASTGSGKTLAYGIPIFEHYLRDKSKATKSKVQHHSVRRQHPPMALILSPTRELAHQLSAHLTDLCTVTGLEGPRITTLTGGLSIHKQHRLLDKADIIIGTPGRLWEIISGTGDIVEWLKEIQFLILDEADRLLSEGHFKEVEEILSTLDRGFHNRDEASASTENNSHGPKWQTLVFSATFQKDLQQKLAGKVKPAGDNIMSKHDSLEYLLRKLHFREDKPRFIDVNPVSQMAAGLKEGIVECGGLEKAGTMIQRLAYTTYYLQDLYLYGLLLHYPKTRTLIFTNSITSVRRLTPFLQNLNLHVHAIHSQMPQKARLRAIERFSSQSNPGSILIATDVAARGLDIPSVELILHYHLPRAADMYVHRSGRTARADHFGLSVLLCAPEEINGVRRLVARVHARNSITEGKDSRKFFMRTIELDRRVVARLKPRVDLSKKIADASLAKEKKGHEDNWLKIAADDLGVDFDSEEFAANAGSKKGRGSGRMKAQEEARGVSKGEMGSLRAELKEMLSKRVNVGVSERYLTAGGVDVDELLTGQKGEFLGETNGGLKTL